MPTGDQTYQCDGWVLIEIPDGSHTWQGCSWFAEKGERFVPLHCSPRLFHPTALRFSWLVRNGFPWGPVIGGAFTPWTDAEIDAAMAAEMGLAA